MHGKLKKAIVNEIGDLVCLDGKVKLGQMVKCSRDRQSLELLVEEGTAALVLVKLM